MLCFSSVGMCYIRLFMSGQRQHQGSACVPCGRLSWCLCKFCSSLPPCSLQSATPSSSADPWEDIQKACPKLLYIILIDQRLLPQIEKRIHHQTYRVIWVHTPLGVFGQDKVKSFVIVGGVVYDLLCVRNADVDSIHYLSSEVTPVKYLQDE